MSTKSRIAFFENKKALVACTTAGSKLQNTCKSNYVSLFVHNFGLFDDYFTLFDHNFILLIIISHDWSLLITIWSLFRTIDNYFELLITIWHYLCIVLVKITFHKHECNMTHEQAVMCSCWTSGNVFLFNKKTCPLVEQPDMSSCSTRRHVHLFSNETCLLVEQKRCLLLGAPRVANKTSNVYMS